MEKLAAQYQSMGARQQWRHFGYSKAAKLLRSLAWKVKDAQQLRQLKGFGDGICDKIHELLTSGSIHRLQTLQGSATLGTIKSLCLIHGVGPKTAQEWLSRGIRTVEQALATPGLLTETQRIGALYCHEYTQRIPREECTAIAAAVRTALDRVLREDGVAEEQLAAAAETLTCGSYRRGLPSSGDVDVLLCRRDGGRTHDLLSRVLGALEAVGHSVHHLTQPRDLRCEGGKSSYMGLIRLAGYALHRRIDLKLYPEDELAFATLYFTGSDHFNRSMRHFAQKRGYSLSDHGIVAAATKSSCRPQSLVKARSEEDIFEALGLAYVPPSKRLCAMSPVDEPVVEAVKALSGKWARGFSGEGEASAGSSESPGK